jgi:peroxiredoxin
MTHERRDIDLGTALRELPVPEHRPGFFEALTAQLSSDAVEVASPLFEHKGVIEMETLLPELEEAPPRRLSTRRWAWAVAAAAVVFAAIGAVAVLRPGGDEFVDNTPTTAATTTTTVETTVPAGATAPTDLSRFVFGADQVPPFTATVVYDMNPLGSQDEGIPPGGHLSVRVQFNNPEAYLYEVLSAEPATDAMHVFGAPGLSILGSGEWAWIKEPGDAPAYPAENFGSARHLLWNSGYPAWDEICATGEFEAFGVETVAGRATTHGRCSTLADDYELWVDTDTGVVMKLRGALGIGDLMPATTLDGGFEIIEFELGESELPTTPTTDATGEPSGLPPFHAIQVNESSMEDGPSSGFTQEIWYQDERTWKSEITATTGASEYGVGSFDLMADGWMRGCAAGQGCGGEENPQDYPGPPILSVPVNVLVESCDLLAIETLSGRAADHYVCERWFDTQPSGVWVPGPPGSEAATQYWIDQATNVLLRHQSPYGTETLTLFEVNPMFPAGIFEYEPLKGTGPDGEECPLDDPECQFWSETPLVRGQPAPTFSGPLLDGSTFRLEELRGQPAVVFRWADAFAPGVLEQFMDDFQALSKKWSGQVGFLGVPEANPDEVSRIMDRGRYTFDNLVCFDPEASGPTNVVCQPADVGSLWRTGWAAWVILDENGKVVDAFRGMIGTFEYIDSIITTVVNS